MRLAFAATLVVALPVVSEGADSTAVDTVLYSQHPQKIARAVRAEVAPIVNGHLDDDAWLVAPVQTGFTQMDPDHGKPSSEKTEFRIVYDDEAIYIGAMCFDREPDKIISKLTRRDGGESRDNFNVNLDPHHDHKTGYFFIVGPSGWMADGVVFNDENSDDTWDGVWEAKTAILDNGWSVEMKIPYYTIRFSPKETYVWGINVFRNIARRDEWAKWSFTPRGMSGWASRFAHLEGIEKIEPKRNIEVFPFALGRAIQSPDAEGIVGETDLFSTVGVDMRYALNSGVSLNATINPDFGQVEADPAVLNLSVFETFFRERRPFFLEGISIFQPPSPGIVGINGQARLFHSRRIGRRPSRFNLPNDSEEIKRPDNSTILGAVKLSGKTENQTAFGVINAVTGREEALISLPFTDVATGQADTIKDHFRIEPLTNWFVGRVQQDVAKNSTVGAQLTAVNGRDFDPAYVGAVDGNLKVGGTDYSIYSRVAVSRVGQDDDRDTGFEGVFYFSKFSGWIGGQVYTDVRSKEFNANELGFMDRNNQVTTGAHLKLEKLNPYWFLHQSGFNVNIWHHRNLDGDELARGINYNMWHRLKNFWGLSVGISKEAAVRDDLQTRGGPVMRRPGPLGWWFDVWTNDRNKVSGRIGTGGHRSHAGKNVENRCNFRVVWRPASHVIIEIEPTVRFQESFAQWVENIDDDADGVNDHFVFGELKSRVFEIQGRASYAFTPQLSVQLYVQPFVTTGDYGLIKEFVRENSYTFVPFDGLANNPDFKRRALRSNLVLRWEYRLGSTLFLVWQQNRAREFDDVDDPGFEPLSGVGKSFTDDGESIFLIKLNRWFGL